MTFIQVVFTILAFRIIETLVRAVLDKYVP
jgi:hypothetical protein